MNTTQVQTDFGTQLDLFTGIFYIVRIVGLGHGVIKPSPESTTTGGYYLEQAINTEVTGDDSLMFLKATENPGLYQWGIKSYPKSLVSYTFPDMDSEDPESCPALEIKTPDGLNESEYSSWKFDSETLIGSKTAYKITNKDFETGVTTFNPWDKSPNGWWLQIDREEPELYREDRRWEADSLFEFQPTNFKLYGESSHLQIKDNEDFSRIHQTRSYLISNLTLDNSLAETQFLNVTQQGYLDYELYAEVGAGCDILSGLTVHSPHTIPSEKYFDFESEEGYDGVVNLVAQRFVKSTDELELEPFSRKNVSAYVTYLQEFRGVGFSSDVQVLAVVDMMDENGEVVKDVLVKDVALLSHLIRSRGYEGEIEEIDGQVRIRMEGVIRGSLPNPQIMFEEGPTVYVPQFEAVYKSRNVNNGGHLS